MRQTPCIVYLAIDTLIPLRGKPVAGLDEFSATMDHEGVPVVWLSNRNRFQLDQAIRAYGHAHPVVAEGACGVYLPEGYFHLRPPRTVRLGRFTCIPVAQQQPAAADALNDLSEATGIATVPIRSLSPRELAQNSGLPANGAELLRHRDFDELFFFAGTSEQDTSSFISTAQGQGQQIRRADQFWSLAMGASLQRCLSELGSLYQRALRYRPHSLAIATEDVASELFPLCDRRILLANRRDSEAERALKPTVALSLRDSGVWTEIVPIVLRKS